MKSEFDQLPDFGFASAEEIKETQLRLFNEHVRYCRQRSPYYRRLLADYPDQDFTWETLRDLPTTGKSQLAEHNEEFLAVPREEIVDISLTSGTTGTPTRVCYIKGDLDVLTYNERIGLGAAGIRAGDRVLLTCTIDRCFIAGLAYYLGVVALGANAIRNGLNTIESHAEILRTMKPEAIICVPSFLSKLGAYAVEKNIPTGQVRTIVCIGEPMRDRQMQPTALTAKIQAAFPNASIHGTYASTEIGTSFTECEGMCGGHPPADLALVELLDDQERPVAPGQPGEVVVTPFRFRGSPLIRFKTGDVSFQVPGDCSCGRHSMRLGPILGRKAQLLKIRGCAVFPASFFNVLDGIPGIVQYYLEARGAQLSDEATIFIATYGNQPANLEDIGNLLYARTRLHVPVRQISCEEANARVLGTSRKPVHFFDYRQPL